MAVFISRSTAAGAVRLGLGSRRPPTPAAESELRFSTRADGEYERRGEEPLYFSERRNALAADLRQSKHRPSAALLSAMKPDGTLRGYLVLAAGVLGLVLILLGIAVVLRVGPGGWIEIGLGILLVAGPSIGIAQRNRIIRAREAAERKAREAEEAEKRRKLGAFSERLRTLGTRHDPQTLGDIARERAEGDFPADAVEPLARDATIDAGFDALSRIDAIGAPGVAAEMNALANATGLSDEGRRRAKLHLYQTVFWHLAADDRLHAMLSPLEELRMALDLSEDDAATELRTGRQLLSLAGMRADNLPRVNCGSAIRFGEICFHHTAGRTVVPASSGWKERADAALYITDRRVLIAGKKDVSVPRPEIFSFEVDLDHDVITIETVAKKQYHLTIPDPVYTAAIGELALTLPGKPKGLI